MKRFTNKLLNTCLFFIVLSFVSFMVMKLAPGDPVRNILGIDSAMVTQEEIDELTQEMGLDQPLLVQYGIWLEKAVKLDLGTSIMTKRPVFGELVKAAVPTLKLTAVSMTAMLIIAIPLGVAAAFMKGSIIDRFANGFCMVGTAIPGFWLGLLLLQLFAVKLHMFPVGGSTGDNYLFLPSLTLGISMAPPYIRLLRQSLLETLEKDFVRSAVARGIPFGRIFYFHILRDSILPIITLFGVTLGSLLGGTVVTEVLFSYPGIGKLAIDAIGKRDYTMIQGFLLFLGFAVFIVNTIIDRLHVIINPEFALKERERA